MVLIFIPVEAVKVENERKEQLYWILCMCQMLFWVQNLIDVFQENHLGKEMQLPTFYS